MTRAVATGDATGGREGSRTRGEASRGMVSYEVTATVVATLTGEWEQFMREHIPALLATGCFTGATLARLGAGRYRIRYDARSRADLDRYFATHAARLREDFTARFPAGIALEREIAEVLEAWNASPA